MIFRTKLTEQFTVLPNATLNDERISYAARGLLARLLSKPNNWEVNLQDLVNGSPAGIAAIRTMIKELETYNYMKRTQANVNGVFGKVVTEVYDTPQEVQPLTDFPHTEKPRTVEPHTVNHTLQSNKYNKEIKDLNKESIMPVSAKPKTSASDDYKLFLFLWSKHFPNKPQPRKDNKTIQSKLKTRYKNNYFRENLQNALVRGQQSSFLRDATFFTASWFLDNDNNWQKVLNGNYDNRPENGNQKTFAQRGQDQTLAAANRLMEKYANE